MPPHCGRRGKPASSTSVGNVSTASTIRVFSPVDAFGWPGTRQSRVLRAADSKLVHLPHAFASPKCHPWSDQRRTIVLSRPERKVSEGKAKDAG